MRTKYGKVFSQILKESLKRKDGVYILTGGGFNADYHHIEVWKDGEIVEKTNRQYATTASRASDAKEDLD